jgi:aspartate racemase
MIRLGTLSGYFFEGPRVLAGFTPPARGARGFECTPPTDAEMRALVTPGIGKVKGGAVEEGGRMVERVVAALLERGASAVVLACTETPVALDRIGSPLRARCVDATAALAGACVEWWRRTAPAARLDKPSGTA